MVAHKEVILQQSMALGTGGYDQIRRARDVHFCMPKYRQPVIIRIIHKAHWSITTAMLDILSEVLELDSNAFASFVFVKSPGHGIDAQAPPDSLMMGLLRLMAARIFAAPFSTRS